MVSSSGLLFIPRRLEEISKMDSLNPYSNNNAFRSSPSSFASIKSFSVSSINLNLAFDIPLNLDLISPRNQVA